MSGRFWTNQEQENALSALAAEENIPFVALMDLDKDDRNKAIGMFNNNDVNRHA